MSVEQLGSQSAFADFIEREEQLVIDKHYPRSPAYTVANAYISEGSRELKRISQELDEKHIEIASYQDLAKKIGASRRAAFDINSAGLIMGLSIHAIEDILVNKKFDISNLIGEYNLAISSTHVGIAKTPEDILEDVEDAPWRKMHEFVKEDPSMSIFFGEGFDVLPKRLALNLRGAGWLPIINDKLIPVYKIQFEALVTERANSANK